MRAPWLQVEMELIEVVAPELAVELGVTEHEAGWGLLRVFRMLLSRCREDMPPSVQASLQGPKAAEKLAREAGYQGDPEAYVDACCRVAFAPFERIEGGVRVRGVKRYDALWRKNNPKAAAAWDKENGPKSERVRAEVGTEPERNRSELGSPEPEPEPEPDTEPEEPPPPPPAGDHEPAAAADEDLTPAGWWRWIQRERTSAYWVLPEEPEPPRGFVGWVAEANKEPPGAVAEALARYFRDAHWKLKQWPTAVFIRPKVWRSRLPGRGAA